MGRLNFTPFETMYRGHLNGIGILPGLAPKISMAGFYDAFPETARKVYQEAVDSKKFTTARAQYLLETDIYQAGFERQFHELGAPAYKIWPEMLDSVLKTSLEIDAELFDMPFPVFSVQLPHKQLRQDEDSPYVVSLLVTTVIDPGGTGKTLTYPNRTSYQTIEPGRKLIVITTFEDDASGVMTKFSLSPGKTIEEQFAQLYIGGKFDQNYWATKEMTKKLITVAISTALIGIGNNPILVKKAALTAKDKIRRRKWARKKGISALGDPNRGFAIGSDIKLPGRAQRRYESREGEGRQLSWGHYRTGHIRRVRFKNDAGAWRWRITFIPHLRVRPDLELKPKATDRSIRA